MTGSEKRQADGHPGVLAELREQIHRRGPVTFARFMELALYHPLHGYYTRGGGPWGSRRDYVTSVDWPIFSSSFTVLFREFWRLLGQPTEYSLVDAGGGDGAFCRGVHRASAEGEDPVFTRALRLWLADRSAAAQLWSAGQGEGKGRGEWQPEITTFPVPAGDPSTLALGAFSSPPACVFANELLDALPVHLAAFRQGVLEEAYVDLDRSGAPTLIWEKPASPDLAGYFHTVGTVPPEGRIVAVNLEARNWLNCSAERITRGHVVLVDYGYPAAALFSPEFAVDPVRTFTEGRHGSDPLVRPGLEDITASLDFTALVRWSREAGFRVVLVTDQYRLLQRLAERAASCGSARPFGPETADSQPGSVTDPRQILRRQLGLRALLSPEGPGSSFRVLILARGVDEDPPILDGLRPLSGI